MYNCVLCLLLCVLQLFYLTPLSLIFLSKKKELRNCVFDECKQKNKKKRKKTRPTCHFHCRWNHLRQGHHCHQILANHLRYVWLLKVVSLRAQAVILVSVFLLFWCVFVIFFVCTHTYIIHRHVFIIAINQKDTLTLTEVSFLIVCSFFEF